MRAILTTSLPKSVLEEIKKSAKKKGISVSAYILHLFSLEKELISEEEILTAAKKARKDHKNNKTKPLHSLKDLM